MVTLTQSQLEAISYDGRNLQLIACAGAGKTEVVARRVARLLVEGKTTGLGPANVVAFTFQDKAAAELKERILQRCAERDLVHGMADMYVGTIHGFCLDLLKEEVPEYLKYEVLNEVQQKLLVDRASKQSGLTASTDLSGRTLRRYVDTDRYVSALDILREAELQPDALQACSIVDGLAAYRDLLDRHNYFDYAAIMERAVAALESDTNLRDRLAARIRHVIVDEYQDVNPIQERIVRLLHDLGAAVCVIGDDDQTIHQWRGSDVENIVTFNSRYEDVAQIRLEENFRSSEGIVETSREFIAQNGHRLPKAMASTKVQSFEPGDIAALTFTDPDDEANFIVEAIKELHGVAFVENSGERGLAYSDMAILLRSVKRNGEPIARALRAAGIKFVVGGMNNLFETAEAQAARELFYFIAGPGNQRPDTPRTEVREAWLRADLGLDPLKLDVALDRAADAKTELREPDAKRWNVYSLQRQFMGFLEAIELREERVPDDRGEIIFYNLGKFSQVISDFEAIHYHSKPSEKYAAFADFLQYRAGDAYDEGWQDNQYANPDAVRIMTVHQAKGMEWPVVFVPALVRNRFPGGKVGGASAWHLIPKTAVVDQQRYEGTLEDERRLFYVAMTRSQKYLFLTSAPIPGFNNRYMKKSEFAENVLVSKWVKRRRPDFSGRRRISAKPRENVANVAFSFSDLKYFFECPYQFKLRIMYGFNIPIHEALGYGKSLHDALAEIHGTAIRGTPVDEGQVPGLVDRHLHVPYAYPALREQLETSAREVLRNYIEDNADRFDKLEFSEKKIELALGDGITVMGRIDLVRRMDTDETTIVDLKTSERSQQEDVTEKQLHIYVVGHEQLTGRAADFVEIYELDERKPKPRSVDGEFVEEVKEAVRDAAEALREGSVGPRPVLAICQACDYQRMCTVGSDLVDKSMTGGSVVGTPVRRSRQPVS